MLVYDAKGRVVAWGHRSQGVDLEKGWIRCDMYFDYVCIVLSPAHTRRPNRFKLSLDPVAASDVTPRTIPVCVT
jgi:hypothetical protein